MTRLRTHYGPLFVLIEDSFAEAAEAMAAEARRRVPVRTGRLRSSIRVRRRTGSVRARVVATARYASVIEVGGWSKGRGPHVSRRNAKPYLRPSVEAFERAMIEGLTRRSV